MKEASLLISALSYLPILSTAVAKKNHVRVFTT